MKRLVVKSAFAVVCVVAASMTGFKAYNAANQSKTDMLLAENVEALTVGDGFWTYTKNGTIVKITSLERLPRLLQYIIPNGIAYQKLINAINASQ